MRRPPTSGTLPLLGLVLLFAGVKPILFDTLDPDCFWHLRVGAQLLREGVGPLRDGLSFSSQATPWTPYSWLAEIGMSRLWTFGGYRAAVLATSLAAVAIFALVAAGCKEAVAAALDDGPTEAVHREPRGLATVLATAFAVYLSAPYLSFRPVTGVIVLLAFNSWLLLRDRRLGERSRAVWAIVPVTVLAANVHLFAGVTALWCGALWLGSLWERFALNDAVEAREVRRGAWRYGALTVVTALAALATPMLPGAVGAALHYGLRDPMVASNVIAELRPFYGGAGGKVTLALIAALGLCVARHHRRLRAGEILWLIVGFALLLKFGRLAPLFALIAAPVSAVTLPRMSDAPLARRPVRWAITAILALGVCRAVADFPARNQTVEGWINRHGPQAPGYPVEAARFVEAAVPAHSGRLINEFNWGGFLEWRLGEKFQTLLDGRTQVFSASFWGQTYLTDDATRAAYLRNLHADAAVLPLGKSVFRSALTTLGWKVVHRDERAEVLVPPSLSDLAKTE